MKIIDTIKQAYKDAFNFSSQSWVSEGSITKSPIDQSVNELISNPHTKTIGDVEYIRYGMNDDIPQVLIALIGKSSTHAGIISKKAKLIAGNLKYSGNGSTGKGMKATAWKVFSENAGGKNISLDKVFKRLAYMFYAYGNTGLLIQKDGDNLISIKNVSPLNFRLLKPNKDGEIEGVVIADTFKNIGSTGGVFSNKYRKVSMYSPDNKDNEQFLLLSNPETDNRFYGIPNYIGAFNFIEADYEFGVNIKNSAENGFMPKLLATFIGRNMSDKDKRNFDRKFKTNFTGSDGEMVITSWVRRKEDMPQFDKLNIENLDRTLRSMSELNDAKILTAHSVTVPSLFGVVTPSKLGVSGSELRDGYSILMVTDIIPARKYLLEPVQQIIDNSNFSGIKIEVDDIPLTIIETRGGTNQNGNNVTIKKQQNG